MKLRKSRLIDEKLLLERLNDLDKVFIDQNDTITLPLLAMIQIVDYNNLLQNLDRNNIQIEKEIENIISSWEIKELTDDKARSQISKNEELKQINQRDKESLLSKMNEKIKEIRLGIAETGKSPDEFIKSLNLKTQSLEEEKFKEEFLEIWQNYKLNQILEIKSVQSPESLSHIESDILDAFLTPLSEQNQVKFQLNEIIKPLPDIMNKQILPQPSSSPKHLPETNEAELIHSEIQEETEDYWDLVGKIVYNLSKKPMGLMRAPIQADNQIYLPVVLEEPLKFSHIKNKYSETFRSIDIDLNTESTEKIQEMISKTLNVPAKITFQPSFFNKWLSIHSNDIVPEKPRIANVWFLNADKIQKTQQRIISVDEQLLEKISLKAWIPASSKAPSFNISEGDQIEGIGGSKFGTIAGILTRSPFGHSILVNRPIPPSTILDRFLEGLNKQNLSELRFLLAKKLKIGEGEVFSSNHLWKINYQERLLLSPHELAISYYSLVPSRAFQMKERLEAKIGIYYHSISESLRFLINKNIYKNGDQIGIIYGFKMIENQLFILYSSLSTDQLVQQVGRKHSHQHLDRFQKRIALALAIPEDKSLRPKNLAIYFLNFIFPMKEEFNSLENAMFAVESQFALKPMAFSAFHSISEEGLKC